MRIEKSIISKYTSYFHDGSLIAIDYRENDAEIILTMESAEVDFEDIEDITLLSSEKRIKGKLHLRNIESIYVDGEIVLTPLKMNHDDGEIFRFRIERDKVKLHIIWGSFSSENRVDDCSNIIIHVKNVYWENIPDLNM